MAKTWGRDSHRLFSVEEAQQAIAAGIQPIGMERISLADAHGRILASPVVADDDYPAFDKSMMDGFAVRSADCANVPATLKIVWLVPAGGASSIPVGAGQAIQINTGAPVPPGADAVVRVEDTTVAGNDVTIQSAVAAGQCLTRRGSDRKKGDVVLKSPVRMGPAQLAAAATAGAASLDVAKNIGVAIVLTGDEIVSAGTPRKPGQIFDSNGPMLSALVRQFGGMACNPVTARDDERELTDRLREAMKQPVIVTVGGMSMGTLDLVPKTFESLGVRWFFHGVDVRPGKPVAYGRGPDGQHVFGLPGNPVSAFVCSWLFVRMAIRGLQGLRAEPPPLVRASLANAIKAHRDKRPAYVPARVQNDSAHGLVVEVCRWGGSGDPFGLSEANALLFQPDPSSAMAIGQSVQVILTDS